MGNNNIKCKTCNHKHNGIGICGARKIQVVRKLSTNMNYIL